MAGSFVGGVGAEIGACSGVGRRSVSAWEDQLTDLVSVRGAALARFGYLLTGDDQEAVDLVQEALVRVFARTRRLDGLAEAERYVRKAMTNVFLDGRRRNARYARLAPLLVPVGPVADHAPAVDRHVDLMTALQRLSPRQRSCVVLYYYEDLPVGEVADRLGCRPGTVKRHLSDAVVGLAATMTNPYFSEGPPR